MTNIPLSFTRLINFLEDVFKDMLSFRRASLLAQLVKNLPAVQETWIRSPGEGNGNPLQYPRLENLIDRGAWWATVHGVTKSRAPLSN